MTSAKTMTLNLTRGACAGLAQMLSAGGWSEGDQATALVYRAGALIEMPELDVGKPPNESAEAVKAWLCAPVVLELPIKLYETAKHCVSWHCRKGGVGGGTAARIMVRELGLAPEGE